MVQIFQQNEWGNDAVLFRVVQLHSLRQKQLRTSAICNNATAAISAILIVFPAANVNVLIKLFNE